MRRHAYGYYHPTRLVCKGRPFMCVHFFVDARRAVLHGQNRISKQGLHLNIGGFCVKRAVQGRGRQVSGDNTPACTRLFLAITCRAFFSSQKSPLHSDEPKLQFDVLFAPMNFKVFSFPRSTFLDRILWKSHASASPADCGI